MGVVGFCWATVRAPYLKQCGARTTRQCVGAGEGGVVRGALNYSGGALRPIGSEERVRSFGGMVLAAKRCWLLWSTISAEQNPCTG